MAKNGSQTVESHAAGWKCLEAHGPWPFVPRRVFQHADSRQHIWMSRAHRKALVHPIGPVEWSSLLRWLWAPDQLNWWIVFVTLLGCVGFMIAALFSFIPPGTANEAWAILATAFTLQGAICFFGGSLLMLPEGVIDAHKSLREGNPC